LTNPRGVEAGSEGVESADVASFWSLWASDIPVTARLLGDAKMQLLDFHSDRDLANFTLQSIGRESFSLRVMSR
jgi:hypothetical protein